MSGICSAHRDELVDDCPACVVVLDEPKDRRRPKVGLVPITLPDERFTNLAGGVGLAYAHSVRETA